MEIAGLQGKIFGVIGLGKTGQATLDALLKSGATLYAWDDNAQNLTYAQTHYPAVICSPVDGWPMPAFSGLVLSPGVPLHFPAPHPAVLRARAHAVPVIGDIELLQKACPKANYIGITGTNGKSTTTSLIGHMLHVLAMPCAVGGNLGQAALSLPALDKGAQYVLELSSYQLDLCAQTRFQTAVWLNISPDHLDRHGGMQGYVAAKARLFERQQTGDVVVMGVDDAQSRAVCDTLREHKHPATVVTVSIGGDRDADITVIDGVLHDYLRDKRFDLNGILTLQGAHNWQNAALAYAAVVAQNVAPEQAYQAMLSFQGLAHRMQYLGEYQGVRFVNDSKATNADAAEKALAAYDEIYWIAGGVAKEGGITSLTPYFSKLKKTYLIGQAAEAFGQVLEKAAVAHVQAGTMAQAVAQAVTDARAALAQGRVVKPVVMLSPACASFDQYPNFEARGADFCAVVEQQFEADDRDALC